MIVLARHGVRHGVTSFLSALSWSDSRLLDPSREEKEIFFCFDTLRVVSLGANPVCEYLCLDGFFGYLLLFGHFFSRHISSLFYMYVILIARSEHLLPKTVYQMALC